MQALTSHFTSLVKQIGQPVIVLIDDLDRCKSEYVIDLLEGVQTLFRDVDVTYVVASDRRWVYASYEKTYETFAPAVAEPGRPLGHLFLEKIFQLSTSVPRMSVLNQSQYWRYLIQNEQAVDKEEMAAARTDAQRRLAELGTEQEVLADLENTADSPLYEQALREGAAVRLSEADVLAETEHRLLRFAPLLEPNPRSMKRFVNGYGILRVIDTLRGGSPISAEALALWTIITLRWPLLADHLEEHPEMVSHILSDDKLPEDTDVPESLRRLVRDREVRRVISGEGIGTSLDENTVRVLSGLNTESSGIATIA